MDIKIINQVERSSLSHPSSKEISYLYYDGTKVQVKKIEEDIIFFILTFYNNKIVGISGIHNTLDKNDLKIGYAGFTCVDKNHRNKGIGKKLVNLRTEQSINFKILGKQFSVSGSKSCPTSKIKDLLS